MVDTGHCRPIGANLIQPRPPQPPHHPRRSPPSHRTLSGHQGSVAAPDAGEACATATASFVLEVKRALASEPAVYRRFVDVVRRCHDQPRRSKPCVELEGNQVAHTHQRSPKAILTFMRAPAIRHPYDRHMAARVLHNNNNNNNNNNQFSVNTRSGL